MKEDGDILYVFIFVFLEEIYNIHAPYAPLKAVIKMKTLIWDS